MRSVGGHGDSEYGQLFCDVRGKENRWEGKGGKGKRKKRNRDRRTQGQRRFIKNSFTIFLF